MSEAEPPNTDEPPSVDELEHRMNDVEAAMQLLQNGELDAAEAAIAALEERIGLRSD